MAHFARIQRGIVQEVIVVNNDDLDGGIFPDSEPVGQSFLRESLILGEWRQCSYSGSFRGAYPGQGWTYDAVADGFTPPPVPEPITEAS